MKVEVEKGSYDVLPDGSVICYNKEGHVLHTLGDRRMNLKMKIVSALSVIEQGKVIGKEKYRYEERYVGGLRPIRVRRR